MAYLYTSDDYLIQTAKPHSIRVSEQGKTQWRWIYRWMRIDLPPGQRLYIPYSSVMFTRTASWVAGLI